MRFHLINSWLALIKLHRESKKKNVEHFWARYGFSLSMESKAAKTTQTERTEMFFAPSMIWTVMNPVHWHYNKTQIGLFSARKKNQHNDIISWVHESSVTCMSLSRLCGKCIRMWTCSANKNTSASQVSGVYIAYFFCVVSFSFYLTYRLSFFNAMLQFQENHRRCWFSTTDV